MMTRPTGAYFLRFQRAAAPLFVWCAVGPGCAGSPPPCPAPPPAVACPPAPPTPPTDPSLAQLTDEQIVRKVLELTGASRLGKQVADGMLESLSKAPDLPPGFLDRFQQNIHPDELVNLLVPIYLKHYDRETLIAAITFYQTDRGKMLIAGLPAVTAESMQVGRNWGTALAQKTLRDLGIKPPPSREPLTRPSSP